MPGTKTIASTQASGTITVSNYAKLTQTSAAPSGTMTIPTAGNLVDGDAVIFTALPTDGNVTFTRATTVKSTGTITVVDYTQLALAVITINAITLTEGTQWTAATDNNTTATSLAGAITTATATTLCTGAATGAEVTVTANTGGTAGDGITITTSDGTNLPLSNIVAGHLTGGVDLTATEWNSITDLDSLINNTFTDLTCSNDGVSVITLVVFTPGTSMNTTPFTNTGHPNISGSGTAPLSNLHIKFSGGTDYSTVTVNGTTLTEGINYNAITSNDATATDIAAQIAALTGVSATATTNVVTVVADAVGPTGNTIGLATTATTPSNLAVSGATLSGGSSGTVGTSGVASALYSVDVLAGADTCNIDIYDGIDAATGTLILRLSCTASLSNHFTFKNGIILANGLFVDVTVTDPAKPPTQVTIGYVQI